MKAALTITPHSTPSHGFFRGLIVAGAVAGTLFICYSATRKLTRTPTPEDWELLLNRYVAGKYEGVEFVDALRGWIVDSRGNILNTADGGDTWTVQASGLGPLRTVEFLDSKRGFAGSLAGELFATKDGGGTWINVTSALPRAAGGFCGMSHVGDSVHIVGRYFRPGVDYFFSPDGGDSWRASDLSDQATGLVDVTFLSATVGLIGGIGKPVAGARLGGALILRTSDGGASWRPVYRNHVEQSFVWKLFPVSSTTVYASLQSNDGTHRVVKTMDGGVTWRTLIVATGVSRSESLQGIGFVDENNGWVGGFFRGMFATTDGGETWMHVDVATRSVNQYARVGTTLFTAGATGIIRYVPPPLASRLGVGGRLAHCLGPAALPLRDHCPPDFSAGLRPPN